MDDGGGIGGAVCSRMGSDGGIHFGFVDADRTGYLEKLTRKVKLAKRR